MLRLAMDMVEGGSALCIPGNHDDKLMRKLQGRNVKVAHGLADTLEEMDRESTAFRERVATFLATLPATCRPAGADGPDQDVRTTASATACQVVIV